MYYVLICLCVVASLTTVYSAVARLPQQEKPEKLVHQEGCYIPKLNKVLPYNEHYSPQDGATCEQYTCRQDNTTSIFSCGSIAVQDGCVLTPGDKFLPYPDCCDKPTCNVINHKSIKT